MLIERILDQFDVTDVHYAKLRSNFDLTASRYKFMCGEIDSESQKKFLYYVDAWRLADGVLQTDKVDTSARIKAKRHSFDVISSLLSTVVSNVHCVQLLMENEFTRRILDTENAGEIQEKLQRYAWETLKSVCQEGSAKEMAETYAKFAEYCCGLVEETCDQETHLQEEVVSAVLTGMSLGSTKAARYFPCLLRYSLYTSSKHTPKMFIEKSENVPTWMFLSWQV